MANDLSALTAFVNEQRRTDFWTEALYGNDVMPFMNAVGTVIPNVKENTFTLPNLSGVATIADGAACDSDFDKGNDNTITQSTITLVKGLVQDAFCPHGEGWETYFTALGMPSGQHYNGLGKWQSAMVGEIMRRIGKRLGVNQWQGNQSGDTWTFNGFMDQLLAAVLGTYNASSNVTGGIVGSTTPTNGGSAGTDAQGAYNICKALINAALRTSSATTGSDLAADLIGGNCYLVMSPVNRQNLVENYETLKGTAFPQMAPSLSSLLNDVQGTFNFPGYNLPVLTQAWIPDSTIILSRKGNQVLAFDLESDFTKLDIWLADDHDTIRWKERFKLGVGWRALNGSNLKMWGPTT